jgi:hypothetical protein
LIIKEAFILLLLQKKNKLLFVHFRGTRVLLLNGGHLKMAQNVLDGHTLFPVLMLYLKCKKLVAMKNVRERYIFTFQMVY